METQALTTSNCPSAGTRGVESRSGGANGDHRVVFTFAGPVTLSGAIAAPAANKTASVVGSPAISADGTEVTVDLTNVSNAQTITVRLLAVNGAGDLTVLLGILAGDTNGDGTVNSGDSQQTRSRSGQPITLANFRSDVNADGLLNSGDSFLVRKNSGAALP